ncbi:MAG: HAD family hydrolase [Armatimonadetes bacterium]|nr:HAD family hydrolase [Armatimonadota bacterium]
MHFIPDTQIEIIHPDLERGHIRHALFDFDGTLSLIREGWQGVMIPMMVKVLQETPEAESEEGIRHVVTEYVDRLTGKQTIYQMFQLCEEVRKRGGKPLEALEYKHIYHNRLWERIEHRVGGLKSGAVAPDEMLLPGSRALLENLASRGVSLYLASGTDIKYVEDETAALKVGGFFAGRIYGALDRYQDFSKQMIIDKILKENGLRGHELVTFGDGYVEIENTRGVGGIAVGVASDEEKRAGIDDWKRNRLIQAGADLIIPEFREQAVLLEYLFAEGRFSHR